MNAILNMKVLVKNVAAVPLTATAVYKSFVLKKINIRPNIENINITSLPFKIVFDNKDKSKTINLAALDKVESNVEIAETIKRRKIIQVKYSSKFILTASMKLIPFNALGDKCKPNKENKNIHKELNKNARKKLFLVFSLEQIKPLSIITGSCIG